jgi:predicted negative regulator of RcsB-dependent stress response
MGSRVSGVIWLVVGVVWGVLAFLGWRMPERVFRNPERA